MPVEGQIRAGHPDLQGLLSGPGQLMTKAEKPAGAGACRLRELEDQIGKEAFEAEKPAAAEAGRARKEGG